MSYELVLQVRVMVDTDQLYIQYHNYSKSWCNVPLMNGDITFGLLCFPKQIPHAVPPIEQDLSIARKQCTKS